MDVVQKVVFIGYLRAHNRLSTPKLVASGRAKLKDSLNLRHHT